ncbi:hypothetical protein J2W43_003203 [Pseudomonas brassicacearum]|uniref:Uncharacterized protein n=1 Tax=Pseudomonas brassicacearum TaxID=930166 RepID=A0AAW8MAY2_9PSED|nr:hypothetical protein [Pseudomonas brassicacearum]
MVRILKALLLPALLVLSLIGVDRLSGKQGACSGHQICKHPSPPVGASLLAMTASHSTSLSTEPPLSRASPLPQGICVRRWGCDFIPAMGR